MKFLSVLIFLVLAFNSFAAKITDDQLKIGSPGSSADKTIKLGNTREIRANETSGKLEFTNDGLNYKAIGSGGAGGGENFNNAFTDDANPNAENGTSNWTASAGDFFSTADVSAWVTATSYSIGDKVVYQGKIYKANTAHTSTDFVSESGNWDEITGSDPLESDQSFVWIPSAQNDYVESQTLSVAKDVFYGQPCEARIEYIGGDENLTLEILNGNSTVIASQSLPAHSLFGQESVFFICPSSTDIAGDAQLGNIKYRITNTGATASAAIKWDKSYTGTLRGLTEQTLPDKFGALYSQTGTILTSYGDVISSCQKNALGITQCFFSGLTSTPVCNITINQTSDFNRSVLVSTISPNQITVHSMVLNTTAADSDSYQLNCSKTGEDSKQTVQVYKAAPKISDVQNKFTFKVSGATVSGDDFDIINGNCSGSAGSYSCFYNPGIFTQLPDIEISCNRNDNNDCFAAIWSNSIGAFNYYTSDGAGVNTDQVVTVTITKKGSDYKTPEVKNIALGGMAINSYAITTQKQWRTESCFISMTGGTPSLDQANCNTWIGSLVDNGAGDVTHNFVAGTWSATPSCSILPVDSFPRVPMILSATSGLYRTIIYQDGSTATGIDRDYVIQCSGPN